MLSKLRGYLTLACVGLMFLVADVLQRTVIAASVRLFPSKRDKVLGRWQRGIARTILGLLRRVGGARLEQLPRIPAQPGVLILMNHQSLVDIPLVVASLGDLYAMIVTRARYASGKPLISHMTRLYQYPLVDPQATRKVHVAGLERAATASPAPLVIFPEGSRSRNGEIGSWKRGALDRVLRARRWTVYLVVVDGFWRMAKLADFVNEVSQIRGRATGLGPFDSPEPGEPLDPFVEEMKARMQEALMSMRDTDPQ